jgi:ATP-binding cassette, sub-family E, member 1
MTRIAVIDKKKCNPVGCGGYLCMRVCPVNRTGEECITIAPDKKAQIDEKLCTGCGICPKKCPFGAITIINLPQELKSQPIHRYGFNGFSLFNLPTPIFGKVVGIIGRNGIGKSTALKILSNNLVPNLGKVSDPGYKADIKDIISYFKGSEAQAYFEKLRDGNIIVSYKPQQVDMLSKQLDGNVEELLRKVDQKGRFEEIVETLELKNILKSNIKELSGGELQRVAIAATVMKKANVYFFDEPTSYLDIKQRMKIAKFIKGMADPETAVMVIEHDMIILDYMTDMVHLMYGHDGVYGVVSGLKTTKAGINVYLSGYLKEENVRFRDQPIKFTPYVPAEQKKDFMLTEWPEIMHVQGRFTLKSEPGKVYRGDSIGILGQNGIGKTTFVKILAGVTKPGNEGEDNQIKLKVAYKPQYLESSDELVMTALQRAIQKYEIQIIRPLNLKELFMRKLSELSGGELQKVAIAHCLSQDADIVLMDEPSAYLDVEQRLIVAKVIRDVMFSTGKSAMIVDHDLLFIDSLSDRLIVFEGEPAIRGIATTPCSMHEGMNRFLTELNITFRRDEENYRPRINKEDSQKDREQKATGKLYYT